MSSFLTLCRRLVTNRYFEWAITMVILVNAILIGVETKTRIPAVEAVQKIILGIFTVEILLRFVARDSVKEFFSNGWNIFDLSLVLIGYIPEALFANASAMMAIRVLRVFRVMRLLRVGKEIKMITTVLAKSMISMLWYVILFVIFIYLFAIIGVGLFKLPDPQQFSAADKIRYEQFCAAASPAPTNSPDPFGTLPEAMFTLFRELTGEDWTDLRYNLITAYEYGFVKVNPTLITTYHVLWFSLSVFLLLNLVTGSIINNYLNIREEQRKGNSPSSSSAG
ncbi:MAG: ion transporter [Bacteroidales bacterium]|nr:ion transporter [Bacteroidales bacterium]